MYIPITISKKKYVITGELSQYVINEVRAKDGKETLVPRWFYQSLAALCTALLHKKLRTSDVTSIQDLLAEVRKIEKDILRMFDFRSAGDRLASLIETK